jgi:hypothetical protein
MRFSNHKNRGKDCILYMRLIVMVARTVMTDTRHTLQKSDYRLNVKVPQKRDVSE